MASQVERQPSQDSLATDARTKAWMAHRTSQPLELTAAEAAALWESMLADTRRWSAGRREVEANVARLKLLIRDAEAKVRDTENELRVAERQPGATSFVRERAERTQRYWRGFAEGLARAIAVVEGRG